MPPRKLAASGDICDWWGRRDSNPHGQWPTDFKSAASTGSATSPWETIPRAPTRRCHAPELCSVPPISLFITKATARYTKVRSFAQYLIEDRDLALNKTYLRTAVSASQGGSLRKVTYVSPDVERPCGLLEREPLG